MEQNTFKTAEEMMDFLYLDGLNEVEEYEELLNIIRSVQFKDAEESKNITRNAFCEIVLKEFSLVSYENGFYTFKQSHVIAA